MARGTPTPPPKSKPVADAASFPSWKAAAVKSLVKLHERAATATRDGFWTRLYVRGLSPDDAAKAVASDYAERPVTRAEPTMLRQLPPGFIPPCLCSRAASVPVGPQWAHEIKHDGYLFIVHRAAFA